MQYRKLGSSDLMVSEISLGSWLTYGVGVQADAAKACLDRAFDLGINFIDTANVYGRGAAETVLGEQLAGRPRDSYILATKLWGDMGNGDKGLSRAQVFKQIDASLARLKTDYVDLYQCHRYDPETPLEETMTALSEIVKAGKVRWIGFSEWSPEQIESALAMSGVEKFVSSQPQYSLLFRRPEQKVIPISAAHGVSQIVWSPLAQGVLTGKYDPNTPPPAGTRATSDAMSGFIARWMEKPVLEKVQALKPIAADAGLTLGQFALAWVLREPNVASAIVGASRPEQLDENCAASGAKVDPALFAKAEALVAGGLGKTQREGGEGGAKGAKKEGEIRRKKEHAEERCQRFARRAFINRLDRHPDRYGFPKTSAPSSKFLFLLYPALLPPCRP